MSSDVTTARTAGPLRRLLGPPRAEQDDLVALDAAVTRPLATSRRLSFLHLDGGVGCSTLVAGVADVVAARRRGRADRVLLVDAAGSANGLAEAAGVPSAERVTAASLARSSARRHVDAVDGLAAARSGARYVGLGRAESAHWPATVHEWADEVDTIARFFDLVVTDWGRRDARAVLASIAEAGHAICLVTSSDRSALERTLGLVSALADAPRVGGVVVAVIDRHGRGPAALRLDLRGLAGRTVLLPADRRLAAGRAGHRPSAAQRRGHLLVAAALVDAARTAGGAR
jgi:MinD-like ATPase involved in chromosome partitioning or flagellar assembly